jgi:hypothetical protein
VAFPEPAPAGGAHPPPATAAPAGAPDTGPPAAAFAS